MLHSVGETLHSVDETLHSVGEIMVAVRWGYFLFLSIISCASARWLRAPALSAS